VIGDPKDVMRVPDVIPECVAFLCVERENRLYYGGTAFYVAVRWEQKPMEGGVGYIVTARHNIERAFDTYGHLKMRVNLASGKADLIDLPPLSQWLHMDGDASDVAALRMGLDDRFDLTPIANTMWATRDVIDTERVGIGEEIVVTGLFTKHYGSQQNLPICRSGVIAAMPTDPLVDRESGDPYLAYLIELRSLGGLSGSPVFIRLDPYRAYNKHLHTRYYLLGLIRGHWDTPLAGPVTFGGEAGEVNMGIAIVTPTTELCRILYEEDEVQVRRKSERDAERENPPVEDTGFDDSDFERF
jgi:hypothetical protein